MKFAAHAYGYNILSLDAFRPQGTQPIFILTLK
jgi:hypothetical protein